MEGFGQLFVVSEDQKLDWNDMFYMTTLPTKSKMPDLSFQVSDIIFQKIQNNMVQIFFIC